MFFCDLECQSAHKVNMEGRRGGRCQEVKQQTRMDPKERMAAQTKIKNMLAGQGLAKLLAIMGCFRALVDSAARLLVW